MMPTGEWIKVGNPATDDDDDDSAFEHVPSPKHAPSLASSSHAAQPSSEVNNTLFNAIHSLSNNVRSF
ncbi:hypothetical protein PVK06_027926 [Gossypium arboreum]|uniref:Uncharacterized protein n=1 Tax=Gossypium arboreum TaxID=29729 RepID=A0ABR0P1K6_GOSAR|nr:hypothetical protein PVK06_027926 [Gossypium arboreum]